MSIYRRISNLFSRAKVDREIDDELRAHIEMRVEDNIAAGMSPEQARRDAILRFGNPVAIKEHTAGEDAALLLHNLWADIRFGLRMLRKNPGFATIAILTLALGIGANTALFSIVDGILLRPLPYPHPNELVAVHASKPNFEEGSISYLNFRDWQRDNRTLEALAIFRPRSFSMTGNGDAERVRGDFVSSDFFSLLGVSSALGRLFSPGEDETGRSSVVLISAGLWVRKFASDPNAIGKSLTLDGRNFTIVGVLPANFDIQFSNFRVGDVYVPIGQWQTSALRDRGAGLGIHGIARLKPGVTFGQAQADMELVSRRLATAFPEDDHGMRAKLVPLRQSMLGNVQPLLLVLLAAVGFVLLIACVNVASLLLARSTARSQEFTVRFALGAGRSRIMRQLFTESAMLALGGSVGGLLLASWGTRAALKLAPTSLPRASQVHLSPTVLCFTLLISLIVSIVFGLLPALHVLRQSLFETLKEGGRGASGARHRALDALVVFEMAMALVLLTGAGLMIRSLVALSRVDPGFQTQGVLTFSLAAPPAMATAPPQFVREYFRQADRQMEQVPGVEGVSLIAGAFPMANDDERLFWLDTEPKPANVNDMHWSFNYTVEPDYLRIMKIPLLRGRFFTDADNEHAPRVVVVDDVFARKFFGNDDPIGKHINLDGYEQKATVIGVAAHVMQWGLDNDSSNPLRAEMYLPFMQMRDSEMSLKDGLGTDVVVRSRSTSEQTLSGIRRAMHQMDQEQVVYGAETMDQIIADTVAARRFSMVLLGIFAVLALVLSSIGIYGVISYLVGQRTQEIGLRMALGANRGDVLRWVLQQGGRLVLIGAITGLAATLCLTRVMADSSMLYGVPSYDPWTLGGVTLLLFIVALAACYLPARRASSIDPMQALRSE